MKEISNKFLSVNNLNFLIFNEDDNLLLKSNSKLECRSIDIEMRMSQYKIIVNNIVSHNLNGEFIYMITVLKKITLKNPEEYDEKITLNSETFESVSEISFIKDGWLLASEILLDDFGTRELMEKVEMNRIEKEFASFSLSVKNHVTPSGKHHNKNFESFKYSELSLKTTSIIKVDFTRKIPLEEVYKCLEVINIFSLIFDASIFVKNNISINGFSPISDVNLLSFDFKPHTRTDNFMRITDKGDNSFSNKLNHISSLEGCVELEYFYDLKNSVINHFEREKYTFYEAGSDILGMMRFIERFSKRNIEKIFANIGDLNDNQQQHIYKVLLDSFSRHDIKLKGKIVENNDDIINYFLQKKQKNIHIKQLILLNVLYFYVTCKIEIHFLFKSNRENLSLEEAIADLIKDLRNEVAHPNEMHPNLINGTPYVLRYLYTIQLNLLAEFLFDGDLVVKKENNFPESNFNIQEYK